ncbi:MAG TPA: sulfur carrier protein ThiS [Longimicrobiaceae bacterium]|nr:sulfur carrier protein ThiS [Longimicrobiaceae bacterium]
MTTQTQVPVQLNGELRDLPAGLTVGQLLLHLDLNPRLVVVEHNGDILRRDTYDTASVAAGDTLELVHFVGGG